MAMVQMDEGRARAASRIPSRPATEGPQIEELKASLRRLLSVTLERAFGIALDRVEELARWFEEVAARGGIGGYALLGGARAASAGRSPVWRAITGAVAGMSTAAKAGLVAALVLAVLLLPLTVVLLLLVLIGTAVVIAVRAAQS